MQNEPLCLMLLFDRIFVFIKVFLFLHIRCFVTVVKMGTLFVIKYHIVINSRSEFSFGTVFCSV